MACSEPLLIQGMAQTGAGYGPVKTGEGDVVDPADVDSDIEPKGPYTTKKAIGQVTIRLPFSWHPLNVIAILYGFLPWIIPISFGVHWLVTQRFMSLYGTLLLLVVSLLNEAVFKPLLKQPRPALTANKDPPMSKKGKIKPGMPSGHVLNATTCMVWALLEVGFRGPGYDENTSLTTEWLILILLLMAPVPWARWYNSDHTFQQCWVSFILGIIVGIAAFYVRATYFEGHWKPWDWQLPGGIPGSDPPKTNLRANGPTTPSP